METSKDDDVSSVGCSVSYRELIEALDPTTSCFTVHQWQRTVDYRQRDVSSVTNYVVVDSISTDFDMAIFGIKRAKVIGLAMEGIHDGRMGELCWLQISLDEYSFLFDMVALTGEAFEEGLKDVLEDCKVVKVVHDCRAMSDYLFSRHNVRLANVFDTQVADSVLFRMRNVDLLPTRVNSLTICLMMHLGLPSALFSTRYLKVLRNETVEMWRRRPASDAILEAAVFRVCYLTKLRLCLIDLLLKRFTDGCDVYLGLMRDARDNQIARLETQMHLVPSEFEDLSFFAESSRRRCRILRQREVILRPRTFRSVVPIQDGICASFFNGGSKLHDMVMHGVSLSPNRVSSFGVAASDNEDDSDDEDELNDESLIPDVEYRMMMQGVNDSLDDLCQMDVNDHNQPANDISALSDARCDISSGSARNDVIDEKNLLNFTTPEVSCGRSQRVTDDLPARVSDDFTLQKSVERVFRLDVDGEMSPRADSVTVGDICHKAQNVVTGCDRMLAVVQQEPTSTDSIMRGLGSDESRVGKPVESLQNLIRSLGKPGGCLEKLVIYSEKAGARLNRQDYSLQNLIGSPEKPFGMLEKLDGSLEKLVRSSGQAAGWLEKPTGSLDEIVECPEKQPRILEKADGSLEKPIRYPANPFLILEQSDESLKEMDISSVKPVVHLGKPSASLVEMVGCSEKQVEILNNSDGSLEKRIRSSEKPVVRVEDLVGSLEKPVEFSEKLVGGAESSDVFIPMGHEKFTGLRNLPNRERFVPRGRDPFVPRRGHNFRCRMNFWGTRSEWLDGRHSGDKSPEDSSGGVHHGDLGEPHDSVGDSFDVVGENLVCGDVSDNQNPVDEVIGDSKNAANEVNFGGNEIQRFILGNCVSSDRGPKEAPPQQGLMRSRPPKKFSDDLLGKNLAGQRGNFDGEVIGRVDLAACGRGKVLAKAVELLQMRSA